MDDNRKLSVQAAQAGGVDLAGVPDWERRLSATCDHCRFAFGRSECCQFDPVLRDVVNRSLDKIMIDDRKRRGVFGLMSPSRKSKYWRRA